MKIKYDKKKVPYGWQRYCLEHMTTYNAIVAPRQHGKSHMVMETGVPIMHSPDIENPVVNIVSDEIKRCYRIYSKHFNKHFSNNEHFDWHSEKQSAFKIPRQYGDEISINIIGTLHNKSGLKGDSSHFTVVDEYGQVGDMYFEEVAQPTVAATNGIVICTGTVEANWWWELFTKAEKLMKAGDPNWFSFYMKWGDKWSKDAFTDQELQTMKSAFDLTRKKDMRIWRKEYLCDWSAASAGTPFSDEFRKMFEDNRVGLYPYDPRYKVGTAWDNGNVTAIWFWQLIGGRPRLINYQEFVEKGTKDIANWVKMWYKDNNAKMDYHIFPHSMRERIQELQYTAKAEIAARYLGVNLRKHCILLPRVQDINLKIDYTRELLRVAHFNQDTCSRGLRCIQQYKRKVNKKTGVVSNVIDKDDYSHGAEALGEFAMALATGELGDLNRLVSEERINFGGLSNKNLFFQELEAQDMILNGRKQNVKRILDY